MDRDGPSRSLNEAAVLFFTDGQPNDGYKKTEDIIKHLNIHKKKRNFNFPIHTFAFGQYTACTSNLLLQISENFNGMFGYIQDAKTLGTIFINGIAYTLCTAATSVKLQVKLDGQSILPTYKF